MSCLPTHLPTCLSSLLAPHLPVFTSTWPLISPLLMTPTRSAPACPLPLPCCSHAVQNEMALAEGGPGAGARRASSSKSLSGAGGGGSGAARYSRFDADVAAMQRDSSTYCDEPEDEEDFDSWLAGFDLEGRKPDIDRLIAENTFMSELQVGSRQGWGCLWGCVGLTTGATSSQSSACGACMGVVCVWGGPGGRLLVRPAECAAQALPQNQGACVHW